MVVIAKYKLVDTADLTKLCRQSVICLCDHFQGVSWETGQGFIRCSTALWLAVSANACYATVVIVLQVYYGGPFANVNLGKSGTLLWDTLSGQLSHRAVEHWGVGYARSVLGQGVVNLKIGVIAFRLQRSQRHVAVYFLEVLRNPMNVSTHMIGVIGVRTLRSSITLCFKLTGSTVWFLLSCFVRAALFRCRC